jgi:hypothetical protein
MHAMHNYASGVFLKKLSLAASGAVLGSRFGTKVYDARWAGIIGGPRLDFVFFLGASVEVKER